MPYSALLAGHLVAVAVFLAGLFASAALLPGLTVSPEQAAAARDEIRRLVAINRFATMPALAFVWAFGIAMAVEAGWYASGWLKAKVAIVLLLSAWHGRQSASLRRLASGRDAPYASYRPLGVLTMAVAAIVALVVVKPF
jgi:putative membrane protein